MHLPSHVLKCIKLQHGKCMLPNETKPSVGINDYIIADNKCYEKISVSPLLRAGDERKISPRYSITLSCDC